MTTPNQKLGNVAQINPRPSQFPQPDEIVSFAGMADLDAQQGSITQSVLRPFSEVCKGYTPFEARDILVAKITPCFENCKIGEASIPLDVGYGSTEFHVIRPLPTRLDRRYLLHFLRQERVLKAGERRMTGSAGQKRVPVSFFEELEIPLPPLEEQRRIAAILDKAGQLTEACASLHAARRQLGESLFVQAFGDPRLNPLGLPSMRLGEIVDCQLGKMLDKKRQNGGSQRPYLRNANIRWFEVDTSDVLFMDIEDREMERFGVRRGDLLVCEGGEPGRAAIWSGGDGVFGFQKALHRLRPDKSRVLPEYLNWVLWIWSQRGLLGDHITSATIAHLTREKLVKINILLPPLAVQECFVRELQMLDVLGHSGISRNKLIRSLNSSLFLTLIMRETG
jgi:type I restriction enzyme S subunit